MKLPCKTNKCILYPVCIFQVHINCVILSDHFIALEKEKGAGSKEVWKIMRLTFHKLLYIYPGTEELRIFNGLIDRPRHKETLEKIKAERGIDESSM